MRLKQKAGFLSSCGTAVFWHSLNLKAWGIWSCREAFNGNPGDPSCSEWRKRGWGSGGLVGWQRGLGGVAEGFIVVLRLSTGLPAKHHSICRLDSQASCFSVSWETINCRLRTRYIGARFKYFTDMSVLKFIFICYMNLQLSLLASKEIIRLKRRSQAGVKPQLSWSLIDKPAHQCCRVFTWHCH